MLRSGVCPTPPNMAMLGRIRSGSRLPQHAYNKFESTLGDRVPPGSQGLLCVEKVAIWAQVSQDAWNTLLETIFASISSISGGLVQPWPNSVKTMVEVCSPTHLEPLGRHASARPQIADLAPGRRSGHLGRFLGAEVGDDGRPQQYHGREDLLGWPPGRDVLRERQGRGLGCRVRRGVVCLCRCLCVQEGRFIACVERGSSCYRAKQAPTRLACLHNLGAFDLGLALTSIWAQLTNLCCIRPNLLWFRSNWG